MTINPNIIGKSVAYPFRIIGGRVAMQGSETQAEFEELINQRYTHILETEVGERVPRRSWGSYNKRLIFMPTSDPDFEPKLKYFTRSALDIHEQSAFVTFVNIKRNVDRIKRGIVDVEVRYAEKTTGVTGTLSYPFNTLNPSRNLNLET